MSNLLKSKFVLGFVAVAIVFAGVSFANAADCSLGTTTLKYGQRSEAVKCLQTSLNVTPATGYFGKLTLAAVKAFQANKMLTADGLVGKATKAVIVTGGTTPTPGDLCPNGMTLASNCTVLPGGVVPNPTGPVSAMLSTDNPAAGTVVAGQATADLMHVTFTGAGTVNSVTLSRGGISDQSTLSNVYLYDGVTRLTDGYSFNTAGIITMNNLGLVVNGTKTISVKADVANADYSIFVNLVGFTAGTSVNTVNLKGNEMYIAAGTTLASIVKNGVNITSTPTVNAGTSAYAVWRQSFQVNTRTLMLKAANFRVSGSAPVDALANVGLYIDGLKAGNNAVMTSTNGSNYLTFDMTGAPVSLTTGVHSFEIRADIVKGSSYKFTVSLQQASDIMVYDPQVGVNLAIGSFTASTAGEITIGAGSATIVVDPTFNSVTNVTGGASNAVIGKFKIHGYGEDVKVTSLPVTVALSAAATPAGIQNVALYFNGSQVGSQVSLASGTGVAYTTTACTVAGANNTCYANTFSLGSQLIIPAGVDSTLEVRADLRNSAGTNYTAGVIAANLGAGTAEGWSSKSSYSTPAIAGHSLTVQTGLLAVAKNTAYASQSVNPNTAGVKVGSFVLQNQSTSESVRVTGLTVGLTTDGTTAMTTGTTPTLTNFAGLRTSETLTPVQPQASNTFSVDFTIAPASTKTVDIFADTGSETTGNIVTTLVVTSLGTSSNVAIDQNGTGAHVDGQTVGLSAGTVGTTPALLTGSSTSAQYIAAGGAGAASATTAAYNFVSTGGSSTINELKFTVTGTATGPVTEIKIGDITAPVVAGVAWLQNLNINVPNGGAGAAVNAMITYAPVGTSGVIPGTTSIVSLTYVKYTSGGTVTTFTPSVASPTMTMVGSKPTVTVNVTSNSGLNLGSENKIGEVTVSADAKGSIKLNDLKFAVSSVGFTTVVPTFTGARLADGTTTISGTGCGQGVAAAASQTIFCEFGTTGNTFTTTTGVADVEANDDFDGYIIQAGTSKTFNLYATVTGANTGTNLAQISSSLVAAGFNWDDASYAVFAGDGVTASPANGTGLTGANVYNFPTGSYTVRQ